LAKFTPGGHISPLGARLKTGLHLLNGGDDGSGFLVARIFLAPARPNCAETLVRNHPLEEFLKKRKKKTNMTNLNIIFTIFIKYFL
jgi:hypothetical protein